MMSSRIGGAVVTLADGRQQHHSNVVSCGMRRSRSAVAAVLTLIDGTRHVIEGASEVKAVDARYLERQATTALFGEHGRI